jgi:hypothetical protein
MKTDTDLSAAATDVMPPPPGGGRWRVEAGKWVANEPVTENPAEPSPPTEE